MRPPGKKVGTLTVKLERKTTRYTHATVSVELRLDVHNGTFHAEYGGTWYDARTKDDLRAKIRQAALFRGDPNQLARQLDAAAQQEPTQLLAAPEAATKTKARGLTAKKASQPTEPVSMEPIADYHERKIAEAKATKEGKHDD
jgi:hypothetical protein